MKKSNIIRPIFILGFALMATFLFRYRPLNTVQIKEGEPAAQLLTLPETRRLLGKPTQGATANGLSGFEGWYEQLPDWLASNSFPAFVIPETRSLAVSLRAMYAETNATPHAIQAGYDLVGNNLNNHSFWKAGVFNPPYLSDDSGPYKGYPLRTYAGGSYVGGYSDHYPVYMYLIKSSTASY